MCRELKHTGKAKNHINTPLLCWSGLVNSKYVRHFGADGVILGVELQTQHRNWEPVSFLVVLSLGGQATA